MPFRHTNTCKERQVRADSGVQVVTGAAACPRNISQFAPEFYEINRCSPHLLFHTNLSYIGKLPVA